MISLCQALHAEWLGQLHSLKRVYSLALHASVAVIFALGVKVKICGTLVVLWLTSCVPISGIEQTTAVGVASSCTSSRD